MNFNKNIVILVLFMSFILCNARSLYCQDDIQSIDKLKEMIEKRRAVSDLESHLASLSEFYFKQKKFNEFYDFLDTQSRKASYRKQPVIFYYKALTRFAQMRHLEEGQLWEKYFENKDLYAEQLKIALERVDKLNKGNNALALRSKLLDWQLLKDDNQQSSVILDELFTIARNFPQESVQNLEVIRQIAEELFLNKESNYGKKLYNVYINGIANTDIGLEKLSKLAEEFFSKEQHGLSVSLYEILIERLLENSPEDNSLIIAKMKDIASKFIHTGWSQAPDAFFAESVYKKIQNLKGQEAFDLKTQFNRAYNLERLKEYTLCVKEYESLISRFPKYKQRDRVYFRLGVISAYLLKNVEEAKSYFIKVINDFPESLDYLNSYYHLGLLDHWNKDFKNAKDSYTIILEKAKEANLESEIIDLAQARLKEIQEGKDIEYNLRFFLTVALSEREQNYPVKLELFAMPPKNFTEEQTEFAVSSYTTDTGCLQPNFTYLWSGQLGINQNPRNVYNFQTDYLDKGTVVVNVALTGPAGLIDGTLEIADIYEESEAGN